MNHKQKTPYQIFIESGKATFDEHLQGRILEELEQEQRLKRKGNGQVSLLDIACFCEIGDGDEFANFLYNLRLMESTMKIIRYSRGISTMLYRLPRCTKPKL